MSRKILILLFSFSLILAACQQTVQSSTVPANATYTDPFTYCAAVGTLSAPDARYTGVNVPDAVIQGYLKAAKLENTTEPMDQLRAGTFWRCMDGKVYACNVGANLPCQSKANTDSSPTSAMNDFCAANVNADFIPESVTGHETIYSWKCQGSSAAVDKQIDQADADGFLSSIWYELK